MRNIILFLLLLTAILGAKDYEYQTSGSFDLSNMSYDGKNYQIADVIFNNDVYFDNAKLVFSPGAYYASNGFYNTITRDKVTKLNAVYINELYGSYRLNDHVTMSAGLFPYRKGKFYEHSFNGNRVGMGIYTITDVTLQGWILTHETGDHRVSIGSVGFERFFKSFKDFNEGDGSLTYSSYKDSGKDFIRYEYDNGAYYFNLGYSDIYQYVNDVKVIDTDLITVAGSYDDEINTGRLYYFIMSYSNSRGDTSSLSPVGMPFSNNDAHFDKFKTTGHYWLVGVKQELDAALFKKDVVLGAEVSYRSPGYHSLISGMPISPHAYADIGYTYNIHAGIRIDKKNLVKLRYFINDNRNQVNKYGLAPVTTELPEDEDRYRDAVMLQWYYEF